MLIFPLQKCDAKRPCTACSKTRRASECEYEIDGVPPPFDHSQLSFLGDPNPSCSRDVHGRRAVEGMVSEPPTNLPFSVTRVQLPSEIAPPGRALIYSPIYDSLLPYTPPGFGPRTFDEIRRRHPFTLPPFSAISSLIFPSIPPQPHAVLSSPGAGRFQLSDAALGDLNMKLYVSRAG